MPQYYDREDFYKLADVEKYLGVQPLAMVPESVHNKKKKNTAKSRSGQSSSRKSSSKKGKG